MTYFIYLIFNVLVFATIITVYLYGTKKVTLKMSNVWQKKFIWLLLLFHLLFTFAFYLLSVNSTSDAGAYYKVASWSKSWFTLFGMGADFMRFITYPFVKLQFSYFNINLLFSIFGLFGFYNLYYLLIKIAHKDNSKIYWGANVLFLLPTFHFYTSGISKDNFLFFLVTTLMTYLYFKERKIWKYFVILLLIFFVRSYLLIFLFVSYLIYILFLSKIKVIIRVSIILLGLLALFIMEPIISSKLNIEIFSLDSVAQFLERVQSYGTNDRLGGGIIDASNMSVLYRMFAFSYLPLILESNSLLKHLTSVENFFLLFIFFKFLLSSGKFKLFSTSIPLIKVTIVYTLITWFIMSFTLYNLGVSTRHKYMYIPYLYLVIFVHLKKRKDISLV